MKFMLFPSILCVDTFRSGISVKGFPDGAVVKNLPADAGDAVSIPVSGKFPGEGNGYPLQYSCLENPRDRGAKSGTRLRDEHVHFHS